MTEAVRPITKLSGNILVYNLILVEGQTL